MKGNLRWRLKRTLKHEESQSTSPLPDCYRLTILRPPSTNCHLVTFIYPSLGYLYWIVARTPSTIHRSSVIIKSSLGFITRWLLTGIKGSLLFSYHHWIVAWSLSSYCLLSILLNHDRLATSIRCLAIIVGSSFNHHHWTTSWVALPATFVEQTHEHYHQSITWPPLLDYCSTIIVRL